MQHGTEATNSPAASGRLMSLDALRGFDMFWIIGGARLLTAIAEQVQSPALSAVSNNLCEHVPWEGFHFHDMIFPLFLFIIGVAMPFSMGRRLAEGGSRGDLIQKILRRTVLMFLLGWVYSGFLEFRPFSEFRVFGVLQRLAMAYGLAGLAMVWFRPRGQAVLAVVLMVAYWALMRWVPVPGEHGGPWTPEGNLANHIDRLLLAPKQMYEKYGDPEGLFSTIPAVATALLGVLTGHWLRSDRSPARKATGMIIAGVVCIAAGYLWALDMPVIKKIWTSSYVLVAGGWSLLLLSLFYWVIDVRGWRGWSMPFVVIGMNAITIYIAQRLIGFDASAQFFLGGLAKLLPAIAAILLAAGSLGLKWLFLWFLYRQRIFLRL